MPMTTTIMMTPIKISIMAIITAKTTIENLKMKERLHSPASMISWLQIQRKKDISNNRKASTEPIIDEDWIAILQQTHANIQVLIAASTSTVFFLFNLSWQLARVFSNSEYWWNSISGLPLHRYLCFDFKGSSPPHRIPKSLTAWDPLQANRKSEHYSQDVPILLKSAVTALKIEHNVHITVHQRFEAINDINRLWIIIHGQIPEIAWTLIYNLVIKYRFATLTPNTLFRSYLLLDIGIAETPDGASERLLPEIQHLVKRTPLHLWKSSTRCVPSISTIE